MADGTRLTALAQGLQQQLRHADRWAHRGGAAFLVLLADADLATAQLVAQRLLDSVRCPGSDQPSGWLSLRLSIGVAQLRHGESTRALVCRADQALQLAKANGGDRFTVID